VGNSKMTKHVPKRKNLVDITTFSEDANSVMHHDKMLLWWQRCIKGKCYREIFQSLAVFWSIERRSSAGLSWTYKFMSRALASKEISLRSRMRW
jgi:hypothetical protein